MPQDTYALVIDSTRYIEIETKVLPPGFDTLDAAHQDLAARLLVQQQLTHLQREQEPVTVKDAAQILVPLLVLAVAILLIARYLSKRNRK